MSHLALDNYNQCSTNQLLKDPRVLLLLLAICEKNIFRYIMWAIALTTGWGDVGVFALHALYVVLIIASFSQGCRFGVKDFMFLALVLFAFILTFTFHPENTPFILDKVNFWESIFPCLRYFIVGLFFIPRKDVLDLIGKVSCIGVIMEMFFLVFYLRANNLLESDDMSRAYQILIPVLFVINYAFNSKKTFTTFVAIASVFYLFALGTRGPIIVTLTFTYLKFVLSTSSSKGIKMFWGIVSTVLLIIFFNSTLYIGFLIVLRDFLGSFGFSTRILDFAIDGEMIGYTSGRDEIYDLAIKKISEGPFFGYGIYGEWPWVGWNVHNMYLEVLIHYGVVLGCVILLWYLYTVLKSYLSTTNQQIKEILLMWSCCVFIRGIFGGSYLQFPVFLLLGFCFSVLRKSYKKYIEY